MSKHLIKLNVNGVDYALVVEGHERLLDTLRDRLGLKSVKEGCGTGDCGICSVILNGRLVNSCLMLAVQARGSRIVTVEGLGTPEALHPLQRAFVESGATQCGFCIPAMILAGKNLLDRRPAPIVEDVKEAISGILCRCTGYYKIIDAIMMAANELRGEGVRGQRTL